MNSYLLIAAKVLRETRQPLSASQILKVAYQLQMVPEGLFGKTQHKTLHARLAEDILRNPSRSEFVRTAPGRFYMREFLPSALPRAKSRKEYVAPLRADQLKRFFVLCVTKASILRSSGVGNSLACLNELAPAPSIYRRLSEAELDDDIYFVRIFVILSRGREVLVHRNAHSFGDTLDGDSSIGIMGFVKQGDLSLFSKDRYGIQDAAFRTLVERLRIPHSMLHNLTPLSSDDITCLCNLQSSAVENSISVVVSYSIDAASALDEFLEPIESIDWDRRSSLINNTEQFDAWSKMIIENPSLSCLLPTSATYSI